MGALQSMGIEATERGDEATATCPNPDHHDRRPSWSVNLDDGRHNCFSCGFGGSFVYLVTKMLGIRTPDASMWVRERKVKDVAAGVITRPRRKPNDPGISEAELWRFTEPPAEALASRALTAEACRAYDVRWDTEHDYWITTIRDPYSGRLWGWQEKNARHFRNRPADNVPKSRTVLGLSELPEDGTALLVESPLDVPYVLPGLEDPVRAVSSYGVSVSDTQVSLIKGRAGRIILGLDNDAAGWRGVSKLGWAFGMVPVFVFNYGNIIQGKLHAIVEEPDGRDPGNLSMDEIAWGTEHAVPIWRLRIPWMT